MELEQMVAEINQEMPEGISVSVDGVWPTMYSFKMKAYVMIDDQGKLTVKGAALKSRGLEPFGTSFLKQGFTLLLKKDILALHKLYVEIHRRILGHELDISEFAKSETLNHSLEEYRETQAKAKAKGKKAPRRAAYELWREHKDETDVRQGDRISYYNCGTRASHSDIDHSKLAMHYDPENPDENTAKLLKRLKEFTKRFKAAFAEEDFSKVFSSEEVPEAEIAAIQPIARRVQPAIEKGGN